MKPFWKSRTFWVNVAGGAGAVLNGPGGAVVPPEWLALALAGINLALRFATKVPVSVSR